MTVAPLQKTEDVQETPAPAGGLKAQVSHAASLPVANTASEAPCAQACLQPGAEARVGRGATVADQPNMGTEGRAIEQVDEPPPIPTLGEGVREPTDSAGRPQHTSVVEHVNPNSVADTAPEKVRTDGQPQAQEAARALASIFNNAAATGGQGQPADGQPRDDESFDAFMASCRDGTPAAGATLPSTPSRATPHREPTDPTREGPASPSHQVHLHRNYATLGTSAAGYTTTTNDD